MSSTESHEIDNGWTIVRSKKPSLRLAQLAQSIGYTAWTDRMPHRPDTQMRNVFDPDKPQKAEKLLARMSSKIGRFVSVVAYIGEEPVGYAWATDDVGNMSLIKQRVKTFVGNKVKGQKPYAWNAQINALTNYQNHGVGSSMLDRVYEPFDDDQMGGAYSFKENPETRAWFLKRAFYARPTRPVDPNENPYDPDIYFGVGAEHVMQWRFESESIYNVRKNIAEMGLLIPHVEVVDEP